MKNFPLIEIVSAGVIIATSPCLQATDLPKAKITVLVKDPDSSPVDEASIGIGGTLQPQSDSVAKGLTSNDGRFTAEVRSNGELGITARKAGYYDTLGPDFSFRNATDAIDRALTTQQWDPWNPTVSVTLKKILKPIAMYARQFRKPLPKTNEKIGLDLFEGDYLKPYGVGTTADLVLRTEVSDRGRNDYDYKLIVAFSNQMDGILPVTVDRYRSGSALRSPYIAPETGFLPQWVVSRSRAAAAGEKSNYDPEAHAFVFRVRTVVDAAGKIVSANYGKIYGDFMNFSYYLNPTPNDRNIEFDPKRNLFTKLKTEEQVTAP